MKATLKLATLATVLVLGATAPIQAQGLTFGLKAGVVSTDLKVTEWRTLDMRRKLAVVRWGEREHLICLAPTGDTLIATRDAPPAFKPVPPDAANDGSGQ
ncbi:MAG TPA: hypothetical protein PKO12_05715 [Holophaga sp.]|nr:hypothetical protein [Holophaga sp.]